MRRLNLQRTPPSIRKMDQFEDHLFGLVQKIKIKKFKKFILGENENIYALGLVTILP